VTVKRYSYSVPASGILDLIPVDRPMVLVSVCAHITDNGAAPSALLEVLNGEGQPVLSSFCLNGAFAPPYDAQWHTAAEANPIIAAAESFPMAGRLPEDLVVIPGETVRLTFASDMVFSGVVVTWREP